VSCIHSLRRRTDSASTSNVLGEVSLRSLRVSLSGPSTFGVETVPSDELLEACLIGGADGPPNLGDCWRGSYRLKRGAGTGRLSLNSEPRLEVVVTNEGMVSTFGLLALGLSLFTSLTVGFSGDRRLAGAESLCRCLLSLQARRNLSEI